MLEVELHGGPGGPPIDVSFGVQRGECLAIAGPSGAGKSTVLRMLAGLQRPGAGLVKLGARVLFGGASGIDLPPEERRCGMVFQEYALFEHQRAWQNVAFGLRDVRRRDLRDRAIAVLDRFGLGSLADAPVTTLSGGERQRVALARAVASEPELLLLDEPLAALDVRTRARAAHEISALVAELDVPAVLVTHQFLEAALLASFIAVIDGGAIRQRGTASELTAEPATAFVADFTGANVLSGFARAGSDGLTVVELNGGGTLVSVDHAEGDVAVSVPPWEVGLRRAGVEAPKESTRNLLSGTVTSVTPAGNRLRVGVALPQPLIVEVTQPAMRELAVTEGSEVSAVFKASATRLYAG